MKGNAYLRWVGKFKFAFVGGYGLLVVIFVYTFFERVIFFCSSRKLSKFRF